MFIQFEGILLKLIGKERYEELTKNLLTEVYKSFGDIDIEDANTIASMNKGAILLIGLCAGRCFTYDEMMERIHYKELEKLDDYLLAKDVDDLIKKHKDNMEIIADFMREHEPK